MDYFKNIFINCPFDEEYKPLLKVLLFTICKCGYTPRIALEYFDSSENRLSRIQTLIRESKYSIHDISRYKATKKEEIYRLNMPFEIGMDFGCKKFGEQKHRQKVMLIISSVPHDYQKALSDLAGIDIDVHQNDSEKMVRCVRNWLYQFEDPKTTKLEQASTIWEKYNDFCAYLYKELNEKDVNNMPIREFIDMSQAYIKS